MGPKTSLSKEQFVHRKSTKSESKLESDCGLPLCLVKKHTVLQAAGNHRTLKIKKDVRKGAKRPKDLHQVTGLVREGKRWKGI